MKKYFLILICSLLAQHIQAAITVTTANPTGFPFCVQTNPYIFTLNFTIALNGGTLPTNDFRIQLSSASGTFSSTPPVVGSANIPIPGSGTYAIQCTIPALQPSGILYRVRVSYLNGSGVIVTTGLTPSAAFTIFVNPTTPNAIVNTFTNSNANPVIGICGSTSYTFSTNTAFDADANGYIWSVSNTSMASFQSPTNTNSVVVDFSSGFTTSTQPITITVTATNCSGTQTRGRNVTVRSVPQTPNALVDPTSPFCTGVPRQYTVSATAGATYYNWRYSKAGGTTITSTNGGAITSFDATYDNYRTIDVTVNITYLTSGNKQVKVNAEDGCGSSGLRNGGTLNFLASPSVPTITPTGSLCNNPPVTLTSSAASTYLWSTSATINNISGLTSAGTYTVTVTSGNVCTASSSYTLQAGSLPVNITPSNLSFCFGGSGTLTANSPNATTYTWSSGQSGAGYQSIPVSTGGVYTVTVSDGGACTGTATTTVTVHNLPTVNNVASTSYSICPTCSAQLSAQVNGGTSPYSYAWTPTTYLTLANVPTPTINGPLTGDITYTVTVTDFNGCTSSANSPLISTLKLYIDASQVNTTDVEITTPAGTALYSSSIIELAPGGTGTAEMIQINQFDNSATNPVEIEIQFLYDAGTLEIDGNSVNIDYDGSIFPLNTDYYDVFASEPNKIIFYKEKKKTEPLSITTNLINGIIYDPAQMTAGFSILMDPSYTQYFTSASSLDIKDAASQSSVYYQTISSWPVTWLPAVPVPGLYEFDLTLVGNGNSQIYKGQFILKQ